MATTSHVLPGISVSSQSMTIDTLSNMSVSIGDGNGNMINLKQEQFLELMRLQSTIVRVDYD